MDGHERLLKERAAELEGKGWALPDILDEVYEYHRQLFFRGPGAERIIFNVAHGLPEFSRPEKSLHIVCDIVGGW